MRIDGAGDENGALSSARPRKRPGRIWLLAPLVLALVMAALWAGSWFVVNHRLQAGVDATAAGHRAQGRTLTWERRSVGGFPFRHHVTFDGLRFASPTGWAIEAPRVEAQANAYRLTHWVAYAPRGLRLVRPQAGAVDITGRSLRASISSADQPIPRIAVEGAGLRFTPAAGAAPFYFTGAERLEVHLRPDPQAPDRADFVVRLRQAAPQPGGLVGFVSAGRPADIVWDSELSAFSRLRGATWAQAVQGWTEAGGALSVTQASFRAGDVTAETRGGTLSTGVDGRLRGRREIKLNRPLQALGALGRLEGTDPTAVGAASAVAQARGAPASLPLVFEAGVMTVGPVRLGEAPRVY